MTIANPNMLRPHGLLLDLPDPAGCRLKALLEELSVGVGASGAAGAAPALADLVFVSRARLGQPPDDQVARLRGLAGAPEVIALVEREEAADRASLLGAGCIAVLNLTVSDPELRAALGRLVERRAEVVELRSRSVPGAPRSRLDLESTRSKAMRRTLALARKVASSDSTVLLLGETGVGKEWLARAIHEEGSRQRGPFIAINCAAVPDSLLESELFGHEKGAFTGAMRERRGVFEQAHGGTLLLDEIAEMSPHLQSKLLRVLQDRTIQRLGTERAFRVDVRLIAATSRALAEAIAGGTFRQDLFFRLAVISLEIPALRDRREDIGPLATVFVEHFRRRVSTAVTGIDEEALRVLAAYRWPGNVRELLNTIERCMLLSEGPLIGVDDLGILEGGPADTAARGAAGANAGAGPLPAWNDEWFSRTLADVRRDALAQVEHEYLERLLRRAGGRVGRAAELAGVDPRSMYQLMRRHGLRKEEFRKI